MTSTPWSLHVLSEVLAAFTVGSPTALRDVLRRVAEAVDAEVTAIFRGTSILHCTGLDQREQDQLLALLRDRRPRLQIALGDVHLYWSKLKPDEWFVVGRVAEAFSLEERALLRAMGRSIELSTQVIDALQAQEQAKELAIREATIDSLTGLPNRRHVLRHLQERLSQEPGVGLSHAALFIDLDRFKQINDAHGHSTGDQYLQAVSMVLRHQVRDGDLVGRLAGDEFVLITLAPGLDGACALARRILQQMEMPLTVAGRCLRYSASIGIALAEHDSTPESLLDDADLAMYSAKVQGPGRYACFDQSLRQRVRERAELEAELSAALTASQIVAHYQPIVSSIDGTVVGFEALARWYHPERGLLVPGQFLTAAEDAGLLRAVDLAVFQNACHTVAQWMRAGLAEMPRLSINLSAASLSDPMLTQRVVRVMTESGVNQSKLFFEITETTLVGDDPAAMANINELKRLGLRLAIDDFGTGYSSLRYLKRFPVGIIKIDRSFVMGLGQDMDDEVIVETVIRMARSLGLEVVAEGVETHDQVRLLRQFGCHFMQGFLYGKPVAADACAVLLAGGQHRVIASWGNDDPVESGGQP